MPCVELQKSWCIQYMQGFGCSKSEQIDSTYFMELLYSNNSVITFLWIYRESCADFSCDIFLMILSIL